jgi:hypothetical protein
MLIINPFQHILCLVSDSLFFGRSSQNELNESSRKLKIILKQIKSLGRRRALICGKFLMTHRNCAKYDFEGGQFS